MMASQHILLIVLVFLAITETSNSSSSSTSNNKRCRNLPTLSNGQVTRNGRNKVVYGCNAGFRLAVMADCRGGKSLIPQVTCEEILCEDDPVIPNGLLDTVIVSRRFGDEYDFTCNSGFKGMGKVVCNECGKWDVDGECTECVALLNTIAQITGRGTVQPNEEGCTNICNMDDMCSVAFFKEGSCSFYISPTIAVTEEQSLQDCINACDANTACQILQYSQPNNLCALLSTDNLDSIQTTTLAGYTLLGKDCQL